MCRRAPEVASQSPLTRRPCSAWAAQVGTAFMELTWNRPNSPLNIFADYRGRFSASISPSYPPGFLAGAGPTTTTSSYGQSPGHVYKVVCGVLTLADRSGSMAVFRGVPMATTDAVKRSQCMALGVAVPCGSGTIATEDRGEDLGHAGHGRVGAAVASAEKAL